MKTQEELEIINEKRIALLQKEETLTQELEEAIFSNAWDIASRSQNRINLTVRQRQRLEESVWE